MDWLEFLQIICVPAFVWLVHKVGNVHKELNDFKVQVAREYATQLHINRLELKIDELRQLIWETQKAESIFRPSGFNPCQFAPCRILPGLLFLIPLGSF